jgi:hypothetical protein
MAKKLRVPDPILMKQRSERIIMLTAYDATNGKDFRHDNSGNPGCARLPYKSSYARREPRSGGGRYAISDSSSLTGTGAEERGKAFF